MLRVGTTEPSGRRYERAMQDWLIANAFKEIDKGTRSRLLDCLEHRTEIERWRSVLTGSGRFRFNHPNAPQVESGDHGARSERNQKSRRSPNLKKRSCDSKRTITVS